MSSDESDEEIDLIVIPFNAEVGQIINVKDVLLEAGVIDESDEKNHHTSVLEKVESKIGKVVKGYDEPGDDFIDDSEIANTEEKHELDPSAFKVVLSFGNTVTPVKSTTPSRSKSEETIQEVIPVQDEMVPYIDSIRQLTASPINEFFEKIHNGTPSNDKEYKITLSNDMIDAIGKCIDAKVKIETEKLDAPPAKSRVDKWKSDICKQIYQHCFTAKEYTFIKSTRVLQNAYKKYLDKKDPNKNASQPNNEAPALLTNKTIKEFAKEPPAPIDQ